MKLFLTGQSGAGKTTVIQSVLAGYTGPLYGFCSKKQAFAGGRRVILQNAAAPEDTHTVAVFSANGQIEPHPQIFETEGVRILQAVTAQSHGLVLMDEIGFIEDAAPTFQWEILRILALSIPVLGVLRQGRGHFATSLMENPRLHVISVAPQNRDALPQYCRKLLNL